jgi:uncharacterized protein (TIGR02145 family)
MTRFGQKNRPVRFCVLGIAISMVLGTDALRPRVSAQETTSRAIRSFRRMADGKQWTTSNLNVGIAGSYCYEGAEMNCLQYGRLYTWESALRACRSLGDGWRLPTDDDWRQLAKHYGGVSVDAEDKGKAAYRALMAGGGSGFEAVLGGGRSDDGKYARLEAHGFYWTATQMDSTNAWFYNFGKGGQAFHR